MVNLIFPSLELGRMKRGKVSGLVMMALAMC